MQLKGFDDSGRAWPVPVEVGTFEIEVDTLIPAVGQAPDLTFLNGNSSLRISKWKTLEVNPETMETNVPGIFAGGDVVSGPATVLEAMKAGKIAAQSIHRYLRGESLVREYKPKETQFEVPPVGVMPEDGAELMRPSMPTIPIEERKMNFKEVELGFTREMAVREAIRCLRCDLENIRLKGREV
jgi:NADH-quinone oxidoreductase subunit F